LQEGNDAHDCICESGFMGDGFVECTSKSAFSVVMETKVM